MAPGSEAVLVLNQSPYKHSVDWIQEIYGKFVKLPGQCLHRAHQIVFLRDQTPRSSFLDVPSDSSLVVAIDRADAFRDRKRDRTGR
jgi:hypothetical protein